jgi:hypothetical protein
MAKNQAMQKVLCGSDGTPATTLWDLLKPGELVDHGPEGFWVWKRALRRVIGRDLGTAIREVIPDDAKRKCQRRNRGLIGQEAMIREDWAERLRARSVAWPMMQSWFRMAAPSEQLPPPRASAQQLAEIRQICQELGSEPDAGALELFGVPLSDVTDKQADEMLAALNALAQMRRSKQGDVDGLLNLLADLNEAHRRGDYDAQTGILQEIISKCVVWLADCSYDAGRFDGNTDGRERSDRREDPHGDEVVR